MIEKEIAPEVPATVDARSLHFYQKCAGLFTHIAKSRYGIELAPVTQERWKSSMSLIKYIDTAIDDGSAAERAETLEYLSTLFGSKGIEAASALPTSAVNPTLVEEAVKLRGMITDKQAESYIRKGMQLIRVEEEASDARTIDKYAKSSMTVGLMASGLLTLLTEPEDRAHPNYRKLHKFIRYGTRVGSLVDELIDLKADKDAGKTNLNPEFATKLKLARYSLKDLYFISRELGPEAMKLIPLGVITVLKDAPPVEVNANVGQTAEERKAELASMRSRV
jgi:hypothetical protein